MHLRSLVAGAFAATLLATATSASAFCGFYVSGADAKLFADATQVVLMREGTRTVLSMQNDYKGPPEKFAMVIPVPVVLTKDNVKILPREVFDRVDKLGAPRLVEYWEQDPCPTPGSAWGDAIGDSFGAGGLGLSGIGEGGGGAGDRGVKVEARFAVGEYEIVVLSAKNAAGLEGWLHDEKYAIPAGAEPYLRPYVQSGMKFFVAKVDPAKVRFENGRAALSPIRFHYDAEAFALPVRLGLINSSGTQDLVVNILAKGTRYEVANYPNVTIPTNLDVAEAARPRFGEFYASLFDKVVEKNPRAVVTEYAWGAGSCDPCPGPTLDGDDLATLGADVIPRGLDGLSSGGGAGIRLGQRAAAPTIRDAGIVVKGRLPREVIQRITRQNFGRFRLCYENGLIKNPKLAGKVMVSFRIASDGSVGQVTEAGGDLADATTKACVARGFSNLSFPQPEGGPADVTYTLDLAPPDPDAGATPPRPQQLFMQTASPYVLTRLHVRYGKEALGEDLVFKTASPISGGREEWNGNVLAKGARPDAANTFQARYAIRHEWKGAIECKEPRRGVWGGPPTAADGGTPEPMAAQKTAFIPRGNVQLASFLIGGGPEIGVVASPGAPAASSRDAGTPAADDAGLAALPPRSKTGCGGCTVTARHDGSAAASLLALAALVVADRRRRRRSDGHLVHGPSVGRRFGRP